MDIGILVPIAIFFGLSVIMGGAMSQMATKNIDGRSQGE